MQRILVAEDDPIARHLLEANLTDWGYEIISTADGALAWEQLQKQSAPGLAILDWVMPKMSGPEICQKLRAQPTQSYTYVILLTANTSVSDVAKGLAAGADDYIFKPFNNLELRARIKSGERILALQEAYAVKVAELEQALSQVTQLKQLLPICMFCKKIRDDNDYWQQIEVYLHQHTGTDFSHGVCPECYQHWRTQQDQLLNPG